jgi:two-component system response regulator PilR (NtrC family)
MTATILLVEDDPSVLDVLCSMLVEPGYRVTGAARYEEAERALASGGFDLLISDVRLPGGLGTTLARQATARGCRVILITGYADVQQMLEVEKVCHLKKPFRIQQLLEAIEAIEANLGPAAAAHGNAAP